MVTFCAIAGAATRAITKINPSAFFISLLLSVGRSLGPVHVKLKKSGPNNSTPAFSTRHNRPVAILATGR